MALRGRRPALVRLVALRVSFCRTGRAPADQALETGRSQVNSPHDQVSGIDRELGIGQALGIDPVLVTGRVLGTGRESADLASGRGWATDRGAFHRTSVKSGDKTVLSGGKTSGKHFATDHPTCPFTAGATGAGILIGVGAGTPTAIGGVGLRGEA